MGLFNRWSLNLIFAFASLIYIGGLLVDVLEVDSAQYASISGEMYRDGSYLEVKQNGVDYLDKPPLVFWTASWMYNIFGVHNWSFKLSSLLFSIIGLFSTYKVGYLLYNKRTGFISMLVLLTCQAFFIYNNDVRTDALLSGAVIFSIWQLIAYLYYKKWVNLIMGFAAIGVAMLAKGPIGIMVPALAMGSYLIGKNNYKDIFKWQWLVGLGVTAIVLLPMSYGLYTQYDAQPEKQLSLPPNYDEPRDSVSGLHFYYWEQSFGRITGENEWKDTSGPGFFFGIFAYSFMPWSLIGFWAIVWRIFNAARDFILKRKKQEWLTLGGFILPFIAFSTSQFKLDHYIYVTYPFAAVIVAEFILRVTQSKPSWWTNILVSIQGLVILASLAVIYIVFIWAFPSSNIAIWIGLIVLIGLTLYFYLIDKDLLHKIILTSIFISLSVNWVFNFQLYPVLSTEYQIGKKVATYISENKIDAQDLIISKNAFLHQINFYSESNFLVYSTENLIRKDFKDTYALIKEVDLEALKSSYARVSIKEEFSYFHVTKLNMMFLNPKTRAETLQRKYLVYLE